MRRSRCLLVLGFFLAAAAGLFLRPGLARAAAPTLAEVSGDELKSSYQSGKTYTLRLTYTDADGDRVKKAQFIDEGPGGQLTLDGNVEPGSPQSGQIIDWEVRGFPSGGHHGYFLVTNELGETARYPQRQDEQYNFTVANIATKWIVTGVGILVSLFFLPFLVYLAARSANRQGNPSSAARIGLLIGIFASLAIFIYEFVGVYDPLILAIGIVAALALLIIVLARR